jgi:hypothetical protein
MTPGGIRAQYLIPNLTPKCECLSIHSSLPLRPRHHAIPRNQRKQFLCRTEAKLPTTSISTEFFEEILLRWTGFFTKLGPQIRLPPVPIFGVNICPFNYGIKVILFRNWLQLPTSSSQSVQHLFSLPAIHRSLRPDPNPRSSFPKLKSSMAGQNQAAPGNFIPLRFIRHCPFRCFPQISPSVFSW